MAREKKTVHKVQMTDGKRQIITQALKGWLSSVEIITVGNIKEK